MSSIAPLEPSDLGAVLPQLLAQPANQPPVTAGQIESFHEYLREGNLEWEGMRCGPCEAARGVFLAVVLPGRTAIVIISTPGGGQVDAAGQLQATTSGLDRLRSRGLHYAQALLEPEATAKRDLLRAAGFRPLAPLVYLERDARYPWVDPPRPEDGQWVQYSEQNRAEFADIILETYRGSLDCPELSGLRPIEDIVAAHQATGPFDPQLWELLRVGDRFAGCLLLARLAGGALVEIVYTGVVPAFRSRGAGRLLVRRALERCRSVHSQRLTVVVDDRNEPAKRLYERYAFAARARRDAYIYQWP